MRDAFAWTIIALFTLAAALVALPILGAQNFYSDDLGGHIALTLRMAEVANGPWFYDRAWFGGFPAFEFYGFLPHWIASWMLPLFGQDWAGATQAVHAVMAASITVLPLSAWWFVTGWLHGRRQGASLIAGGLSIVLALFLTVFNPGTIAGIQYLVVAGVFGQLPGWVLLFFFLGTLGRAVGQGRAVSWVSILLFSLLMAAHPFTAIVGLLIAVLMVFGYVGWRPALLHGGLMFFTSAWFWFPFLAWSSGYGEGVPHSGDTTVISVLFDRWLDFFHGIETTTTGLIAEALVTVILAVTLCHGVLGKRGVYRSALLISGAGLVMAGPELTEAVSLSLQYDRLLITTAIVLALVGLVGFVESLPALPRYVERAASGLCVILGAQIALQGLEAQPLPSSKGWDGLIEERLLLRELKSLPDRSRIFFELPKRTSKSEYSPGKFVESRLWFSTRYEAINGVLIQSSRPYHLYAIAAKKMGALTFSSRSIGWEKFNLNEKGMVDFLRRNAITHFVSSNETFRKNLVRLEGIHPVVSVGRYNVYSIPRSGLRLRALTNPVIGYVDLTGSLPFRFVDTFFETRGALSGRVRLVSLDAEDVGHVPVDALIVNMDEAPDAMSWRIMSVQGGLEQPILTIDFEPTGEDRLASRDRFHEIRRYRQVANYLIGSGFERAVWKFALEAAGKAPPQDEMIGFEWKAQGQEVEFTGLTPGRWYEFAYSEFPSWRADGAILRQGSAGHWMLYPDGATVTAHYDRWSTRPVILGWLISLLGLLLLLFMRFKFPQLEVAGNRTDCGSTRPFAKLRVGSPRTDDQRFLKP